MNVWDRAKVRTALEAVKIDCAANMKLLLLLSQPAYKGKLSDLFGVMGEQELLRNRIYTIHKHISNPKGVVSFVDSHIRKIDWQLRRIYRARNRIVHLGEVPRFVASLADSAHDYFDQIVTTVADISRGPNGFADFDAGFSYLEWEYRAYCSEIASINYADAESVARLVWGRRRAIERYDVIDRVRHPKRPELSDQALVGES